VNFHLEDQCFNLPGLPNILETSVNSFKDLKFEEADPFENTSEGPNLPDISAIEKLTNEIYPLMLARHAPCPGTLDQCAGCCCNSTESLYSCSDCFTLLWYCQNCIVAMHQYNPLHQVRKWSKEFQCKESIGLADLGLTIQLMHEDGKPCSSMGRSRDLHVLSSNGFHRLRYYLCACDITHPHPQPATPRKLIANGLFPATFSAPAVAFTFQTLSLYDILNLYGHINIKQFCDSLIANVPDDLKRQEDVSKLK
jgi:hypothetical protein